MRKTRRRHSRRGGSTPTKKAKSLKMMNDLYRFNVYETLTPAEKILVDNATPTPKTKKDKAISANVNAFLISATPGFNKRHSKDSTKRKYKS